MRCPPCDPHHRHPGTSLRSIGGDSGRDSLVSDKPEATAPEDEEVEVEVEERVETGEVEERVETGKVEESEGFLQSAMEEWEYSKGYLVYKALPCRLVD